MTLPAVCHTNVPRDMKIGLISMWGVQTRKQYLLSPINPIYTTWKIINHEPKNSVMKVWKEKIYNEIMAIYQYVTVFIDCWFWGHLKGLDRLSYLPNSLVIIYCENCMRSWTVSIQCGGPGMSICATKLQMMKGFLTCFYFHAFQTLGAKSCKEQLPLIYQLLYYPSTKMWWRKLLGLLVCHHLCWQKLCR
jgi:hypothetical protein